MFAKLSPAGTLYLWSSNIGAKINTILENSYWSANQKRL